MATIRTVVRSGAYYDSVVLMHLQRSLATLPGVFDAGVVMGTDANKLILAQSDLLSLDAQAAGADDLLLVVRAGDDDAAAAALDQVDRLLAERRAGVEHDYLPRSLESAAQALPSARWVLVSVPGRYAASVARDALRLGRHVFLYSDNVPLQDEVELKRMAAQRGLLVMGPDCGTAIVRGVGLGFANRVRPGPIGLVAASGTGLQQVSSRIHQLGGGVTHALGTGGRDLSEAVGAATARQALDLLDRDPETQVIVLVSKPPAPQVAERLIEAARSLSKPVVIDLIGHSRPLRRIDNLRFVSTFDEAAAEAVRLAEAASDGRRACPQPDRGSPTEPIAPRPPFAPGQRYLRGLFSGGTLAYEAQLLLQPYLPAVYSNAPLAGGFRLANSLVSQEHTIVDLGEDEFTVGRLHPMMDNDLRLRRLAQEAQDPAVAVLLLDVVLGYGAHPDPAGELAPAIARARSLAEEKGRHLAVVAVLAGTDEDPQGLAAQSQQLAGAGALVFTSNDEAMRTVGSWLRAPGAGAGMETRPTGVGVGAEPRPAKVDLGVLREPPAAINVGLESFLESLTAQGCPAIQVDWRPPAGGNEKLAAILERMKHR
jgi:FdrA protein